MSIVPSSDAHSFNSAWRSVQIVLCRQFVKVDVNIHKIHSFPSPLALNFSCHVCNCMWFVMLQLISNRLIHSFLGCFDGLWQNLTNCCSSKAYLVLEIWELLPNMKWNSIRCLWYVIHWLVTWKSSDSWSGQESLLVLPLSQVIRIGKDSFVLWSGQYR